MATPRQHHDIMDSASMRRVAQGFASNSISVASSTTTTTSTTTTGSQQPGHQSWHQVEQWSQEYHRYDPNWTAANSSQFYAVYGNEMNAAAASAGNFLDDCESSTAASGNFSQGSSHHHHPYQFQSQSVHLSKRISSSSVAEVSAPPSVPSMVAQSIIHEGAMRMRSNPNENRLRPHSTPATLCWLEKNYELSEGVCIPRNVVYFNYVDFCNKNAMQPVNAASFGKIIRQMFQSLTTRRLGTRGQSRYHYYGLAVKADSIYYSPGYSNRKYPRLESQWNPPPTLDPHEDLRSNYPANYLSKNYDGKSYGNSNRQYQGNHSSSGGNGSMNCGVGGSGGGGGGGASSSTAFQSLKGVSSGFASVQQLPDFPSFADFEPYLDPMISEDQLQSLATMYRAHSQRIMDSVNKFSFVEIPNLFKHFWQELPTHILCFIGHKSIVTFIGVCDKILYATIIKAILPTPVQILPEDIMKIVRSFATDLVTSLQQSLKRAPTNLAEMKMKLVMQLSHCLKRRTSVNHLYQAVSLVMAPSNQSAYDCLQAEWHYSNWETIAKTSANIHCPLRDLMEIGMTFQKYLSEKTSIGEICRWVQSLIRSRAGVNKSADVGIDWYVSSQTSDEVVDVCEKIFRSWAHICNKVFPNMQPSLSHYPSSPLQLLKILLNELLIHEMEMIISEKLSSQIIYQISSRSEEINDNALTLFLESFGQDFLSRIKANELNVKQEIFEHNASNFQVNQLDYDQDQDLAKKQDDNERDK